MALSDELLSNPQRLAAVRELVARIVGNLGLAAGFLVDEDGAPFATVGHIEFQFPHPLSQLQEGDAVLKALLGEAQSTPDEASDYVVEAVGRRALLVLVAKHNLAPSERSATRKRARSAAKAMTALL